MDEVTLNEDDHVVSVTLTLREGGRALDTWQRKAVAAARQQGRTWEEIGTACGVSRQAAWERFSAE